MKALLEHAQREVVKVERTTVAQRKERYAAMLDEYQAGEGDPKALVEFDQIAKGIVDEILGNVLPDEPRVLSAEEAKALMQEYLHIRQLTETFAAREKARRAAIFADMDARLLAEGIQDPQNHNATLEVPELGYKFCREGAGYNDPSLDEDKLRALLGEEVWSQVCDEREVPAHTELVFNGDKLLDLATKDPAVMLALEDSLKPGSPKTPRLRPREM
jgi:hypothetical protein